MKRFLPILMATCMFTLTACGSSSSDEENKDIIMTEEGSDYSYLNGMEKDILYVLHKDNTFEPTAFNCATFNYGVFPYSADPDRVMWFMDDFKDIPTFYAQDGDKLVLYSTSDIDEDIGLERFEDLGVSVGLCHLTKTDSGKFTVSTMPEDNCSYPNSDADAILEFTNEKVIVDTIQGIPIRTLPRNVDDEKQVTYDGSKNKSVTDYGTISGLVEDNYYDLEIYDGTVKNVVKLKANVHIMGSCDTKKGINYHFLDNYLIEYELPDSLRTGYYNLDAIGLFRYIAPGDAFSATTNYNLGIPDKEKIDDGEKDDESAGGGQVAVDPARSIYGEPNKDAVKDAAATKDDSSEPVIDPTIEGTTEKDTETTTTNGGTTENTYEITATETYIRFHITLGGDDTAINNVTGTVKTPDGSTIELNKVKTTGDLYADIYSENGGQYTVVLNNTDNVEVDISASAISEEEAKSGDIE